MDFYWTLQYENVTIPPPPNKEKKRSQLVGIYFIPITIKLSIGYIYIYIFVRFMKNQVLLTSVGGSYKFIWILGIGKFFYIRDCRGRDRMVVGFTTTCTISDYRYYRCELESR